MNKKLTGVIGLVVLAAIIGAANLILSNLPLRLDLTGERLYTLSKGSKAVLGKLEADVTLKFYFSASSAEMPMQLKTYAQQVQNLLKEYERAGNGHLALEAYDPKPDSDAEEWAQRYGVEPQNVNPFGQPVYFGLVAVCGDREETLARLSPRAESTLEYDITRLVTRVAWPERPVVGVMTSIQGVFGQPPNPMMQMQRRQQAQGWAAFTELKKDYDVREIPPTAESIDDDVKALVVLHAKDLNEKTLFAIDQFVIRGGRLIACVDPFSVMDMLAQRQQQNPMMMQMGGQDGPSTLGKLFDAWGVTFDTSKIVADLAAADILHIGLALFLDCLDIIARQSDVIFLGKLFNAVYLTDILLGKLHDIVLEAYAAVIRRIVPGDVHAVCGHVRRHLVDVVVHLYAGVVEPVEILLPGDVLAVHGHNDLVGVMARVQRFKVKLRHGGSLRLGIVHALARLDGRLGAGSRFRRVVRAAAGVGYSRAENEAYDY